jgi:hypothetical protein
LFLNEPTFLTERPSSSINSGPRKIQAHFSGGHLSGGGPLLVRPIDHCLTSKISS